MPHTCFSDSARSRVQTHARSNLCVWASRCASTMLLKSLAAALFSAAVLVSAKSGNVTQGCTPVVSGQLQSWSFNTTLGPTPLGVNATKSGAYVTDGNFKHNIHVVYETCSRTRAVDHGAISAPYTRVSLKNDSKWCLTHNAAKKNVSGQLVLEHCSDDVEDAQKTQEFGIFYGKGMKGQNATLSAYKSQKNCFGSLPFVEKYIPAENPINITRMTTGGSMGAMYASVLQIGNPHDEL